jgi:hypothetical protein
VATLAGCGIPAEPQARPVERPPGPFGALATTAAPAPDPGVVAETFFLTRDAAVIPVTRRVRGDRTVHDVMADLMAAPNDAERAAGFGSALTGANLAGTVALTDNLAVVALTAAPDGRSDQVLAYAQVVCTLDARPDVSGVIFTLHNEQVGVPGGTGVLSEGPLTTADYATLIAEP